MPAEIVSNTLLHTAREICQTVAAPNESVSSLARFAASPGAESISIPKLLLPLGVRRGDGVGPVMDLGEYRGKLLVVTLAITDVMERTGLTVSVWGSEDQTDWGAKPLVTFRQRQYCGVYSVLLHMAPKPSVVWARVQWDMHRWGKSEHTPAFGFEVFVEQSGARISGAAVAERC